jgi:hypothetical protein
MRAEQAPPVEEPLTVRSPPHAAYHRFLYSSRYAAIRSANPTSFGEVRGACRMHSIRKLADRLLPKPPSAVATQQAPAPAHRSYRPWRLDAAFRHFQRAYPAYESTGALDMLRATEYARLDRQGQVYLDYTGGSL